MADIDCGSCDCGDCDCGDCDCGDCDKCCDCDNCCDCDCPSCDCSDDCCSWSCMYVTLNCCTDHSLETASPDRRAREEEERKARQRQAQAQFDVIMNQPMREAEGEAPPPDVPTAPPTEMQAPPSYEEAVGGQTVTSQNMTRY